MYVDFYTTLALKAHFCLIEVALLVKCLWDKNRPLYYIFNFIRDKMCPQWTCFLIIKHASIVWGKRCTVQGINFGSLNVISSWLLWRISTDWKKIQLKTLTLNILLITNKHIGILYIYVLYVPNKKNAKIHHIRWIFSNNIWHWKSWLLLRDTSSKFLFSFQKILWINYDDRNNIYTWYFKE